MILVHPAIADLEQAERRWGWTRFLPDIAKRGATSVNQALQQVLDGETQIHLIIDDDDSAVALIGTRDGVRADGRAVAYLAWGTGRNRKRWIHLLADLEEHFRARGYATLKPIARLGWRPMFEAAGYRLTHYCMEKEL